MARTSELRREHEYHAVRKECWDQLWHAVYLVDGGRRETYCRVSREDALYISGRLAMADLSKVGLSGVSGRSKRRR